MDIDTKAVCGLVVAGMLCVMLVVWMTKDSSDRQHDANAVRREAIMLGHATGTPPEYRDFQWRRK